MKLMGLCKNSSGLIAARVSSPIFLLQTSKFAFTINTLPITLLQCTYSQFLSSVPFPSSLPPFAPSLSVPKVFLKEFAYFTSLMYALTNVVVSWRLRGRPLSRSELLFVLLVQAFRIWYPCSDFLLRRCGCRLFWGTPGLCN